jgi:hypothetical protein
MSTWTCRVLAASGALAALVLMAGCAAQAPAGPAIRALSLLDGAAVAQGPAGYCVDPRTSRPGAGFAVMGGCAILSDDPEMPETLGILTVQVGAAGSAAVAGSEEALAGLMNSARGLALLASSGRPEAIRVEAIERAPGLVAVRFSDSAPPAVPGAEAVEWRAFLDLGDRLATVTVRGLARAPLTPGEGRRLLSEAVAVLRAVNPPAAAP